MVLYILLALSGSCVSGALGGVLSLDKYLSVPFSILVSRLNYGVWAFSSREHTDAQIIGLGDPLIPIKVI